MPQDQQVVVDGRELALTNLEKTLYRGNGYTKACYSLLHTGGRVATASLPRERPATRLRLPDRVGSKSIYEKDALKYMPEWIGTAKVPRRAGGKPIRYICVNDAATLVWCANRACLGFHSFLHRDGDMVKPTSEMFDLDPGEEADLVVCAEVAGLVRGALRQAGRRRLIPPPEASPEDTRETGKRIWQSDRFRDGEGLPTGEVSYRLGAERGF